MSVSNLKTNGRFQKTVPKNRLVDPLLLFSDSLKKPLTSYLPEKHLDLRQSQPWQKRVYSSNVVNNDRNWQPLGILHALVCKSHTAL